MYGEGDWWVLLCAYFLELLSVAHWLSRSCPTRCRRLTIANRPAVIRWSWTFVTHQLGFAGSPSTYQLQCLLEALCNVVMWIGDSFAWGPHQEVFKTEQNRTYTMGLSTFLLPVGFPTGDQFARESDYGGRENRRESSRGGKEPFTSPGLIRLALGNFWIHFVCRSVCLSKYLFRSFRYFWCPSTYAYKSWTKPL